jgi:hypothetical protein
VAWIYDIPPAVLALCVLGLMLAANEFGFRIGRGRNANEDDQSRAVSGALKASILGLVALLLGFSYSITSGRFQMRQRLVLDEANSIGTCYLRAGLLPEPFAEPIQSALTEYTDLRIEHFQKALDPQDYESTAGEMNRALDSLWNAVQGVFLKNPDLVRSAELIPAANEVIDLSSTRSWLSRNHMPASMLWLLVACMIVSGGVAGHSSGQSSRRHAGLWLTLNLLVMLIFFIVLDFDRPRRGLIQVSHQPLIEQRANMKPPPSF